MSEVAAAPAAGGSAPSSPSPSSTPSTGGGGQPQRTAPSQGTQPKTPPTTGGATATPTQGAPQQTPAQDPVREFKINGKIVKMTQKEADDYVSMSYAAQERFNEAAKIRKEIEAREQGYSKDPVKAFLDYAQKANLSPEQTRQALEDYYAKQYIEPESLSKEELALREREAKVRQWEEQQKEREANDRQAQERKMTDEAVNNLTQEIISALETAKLPQKNKFLLQRMAFYMKQNLDHGWNAPREMIVKQVINEHKGIVGSFLSDASIDQIIDYAGQEFVDRILKHSLEKLREDRQKREQPFVPGAQNDVQNNGKIDYSEVNRRLRDMRSGRFVGAS